MTFDLRSPVSGEPLRPDTPHSLTDGRARWPVVDGIAYLRTGRDALAGASLAALDGGDREGALVLLLGDQDDWWDGPEPARADLVRLVREADRLTLRDAMALLGYGRVGDYFAHRWSDPTFLAGLALIEAHWAAPRSAFELACGIGHYLRELALRGVAVSGGDVVFSKLWLARHWVVGDEAPFVCFDAAAPWPVADRRADLVLCQDAFYFLEPKDAILAALRRMASPAGSLVVGHVHNSEAANLSGGHGIDSTEIARLFPDGTVYDDAELTRAAADGRVPRARPVEALRTVEAFSVATGQAGAAATGLLTLPAPGTALRRNPLYRGLPRPHADVLGRRPSLEGRDTVVRPSRPSSRSAPQDEESSEFEATETGGWEMDAGITLDWPSERYRDEYASRATYPDRTRQPAGLVAMDATLAAAARRRELVALPERW